MDFLNLISYISFKLGLIIASFGQFLNSKNLSKIDFTLSNEYLVLISTEYIALFDTKFVSLFFSTMNNKGVFWNSF